MVHMSRAYLMEKQMPQSFWYYTIKHSAWILNMIPGRYKDKLVPPFMLIHGMHPDQSTWLPLFSICYFHHEKDSDVQRSKNQSHTMDGLSLDNLQHPIPLWSTMLAISATRNPTATNSTHTNYIYLKIL